MAMHVKELLTFWRENKGELHEVIGKKYDFVAPISGLYHCMRLRDSKNDLGV